VARISIPASLENQRQLLKETYMKSVKGSIMERVKARVMKPAKPPSAFSATKTVTAKKMTPSPSITLNTFSRTPAPPPQYGIARPMGLTRARQIAQQEP
jgi:hypothetical protein